MRRLLYRGPICDECREFSQAKFKRLLETASSKYEPRVTFSETAENGKQQVEAFLQSINRLSDQWTADFNVTLTSIQRQILYQ